MAKRTELQRLADHGDEEARGELERLDENLRYDRAWRARQQAKIEAGEPQAIARRDRHLTLKRARYHREAIGQKKKEAIAREIAEAKAGNPEVIAARERRLALRRASYRRRTQAAKRVADQDERAAYKQTMTLQRNGGPASEPGVEDDATDEENVLDTLSEDEECRINVGEDANASEYLIDIPAQVNHQEIGDMRAKQKNGQFEKHPLGKGLANRYAIDQCEDDDDEEIVVKQIKIHSQCSDEEEEAEIVVKQEWFDSTQSNEESEYLRPIKEEHTDQADTAAGMNSEVTETLDRNEVEKQPAMNQANEAPIKREVVDLSETDEDRETELERVIRSQAGHIAAGSSFKEAELKLELERVALERDEVALGKKEVALGKKELDLRLRLLRVQNSEC